MQDIEQQRLQNLRILVHPLEVESLESREGQIIFNVVKQRAILAAFDPLMKLLSEIPAEDIRECEQAPLIGIKQFVRLRNAPVSRPSSQ